MIMVMRIRETQKKNKAVTYFRIDRLWRRLSISGWKLRNLRNGTTLCDYHINTEIRLPVVVGPKLKEFRNQFLQLIYRIHAKSKRVRSIEGRCFDDHRRTVFAFATFHRFLNIMISIEAITTIIIIVMIIIIINKDIIAMLFC